MLNKREKIKFINNGYLDLFNVFDTKQIKKLQKNLRPLFQKKLKFSTKILLISKKKQGLQKLHLDFMIIMFC